MAERDVKVEQQGAGQFGNVEVPRLAGGGNQHDGEAGQPESTTKGDLESQCAAVYWEALSS